MTEQLIERLAEEVIAAIIKKESPMPCNSESMPTVCSHGAPSGFMIVVLDHGFIYVGDLSWKCNWGRVTNARNIRYWGTTNGLGELRYGPTQKTKLDDSGTVVFPLTSLVHCLHTKESAWK